MPQQFYVDNKMFAQTILGDIFALIARCERNDFDVPQSIRSYKRSLEEDNLSMVELRRIDDRILVFEHKLNAKNIPH